jgi:predicted RNA-binding Zn-ribbon protein involved in translation (DUF1610 family)
MGMNEIMGPDQEPNLEESHEIGKRHLAELQEAERVTNAYGDEIVTLKARVKELEALLREARNLLARLPSNLGKEINELRAKVQKLEEMHGSCPYCKHELNATEGTGTYECPRCIEQFGRNALDRAGVTGGKMGTCEPDREAANKWTDSASMGLTKRDGHLEGQRIGWTARGKAVLGLLLKIEWSGYTVSVQGVGNLGTCPDCEAVEHDPHMDDCELAALIAEIRAEGQMGTAYDRAGEGEES